MLTYCFGSREVVDYADEPKSAFSGVGYDGVMEQ